MPGKNAGCPSNVLCVPNEHLHKKHKVKSVCSVVSSCKLFSNLFFLIVLHEGFSQTIGIHVLDIDWIDFPSPNFLAPFTQPSSLERMMKDQGIHQTNR